MKERISGTTAKGIPFALRVWDVALTEEQVLNEFNKDNQDYQIL